MFCKLCLNAHNRSTALTHCVSNLLDRLARGVGGCFHEDLSAVTLVARKPCICEHMLILGKLCVLFCWHCERQGRNHCCTMCLVCLLLCSELPLVSIVPVGAILCAILCWSVSKMGVCYVLQIVSDCLQS